MQLISEKETPKWYSIYKDPYIADGYRKFDTYSTLGCIKSIFYIHNETINIWSHLGGWVVLSLYFIPEIVDMLSRFPSTTYIDKIIWAIFYVGFLISMACSTLFHIFINHSKEAYVQYMKYDYISIIIMIWASNVMLGYYLLYNTSMILIIFLTILTSIAGFLINGLVFNTGLYNKVFRSAILSLYACSSIFLTCYNYIYYGDDISYTEADYSGIVKIYSAYGVGVIFYITHFPENIFGQLNILFIYSHQLFHFSVLIGSAYIFQTGLSFMEYVHNPKLICGS